MYARSGSGIPNPSSTAGIGSTSQSPVPRSSVWEGPPTGRSWNAPRSRHSPAEALRQPILEFLPLIDRVGVEFQQERVQPEQRAINNRPLPWSQTSATRAIACINSPCSSTRTCGFLYQLPETPTLPVSPGIPRFPEPPKYDSLIPDQTDSLDRRAT